MPVKGDAGKSAAQAITGEMQNLAKEVTREAMTVWNTAAQERVMEAAEGRSGMDDTRDSRGSLQGRQSNDLHELAQSFTVPQWDDSEQAWRFAVTHFSAGFHEWGVTPHEIRAKQADVLAFPWPDAPEEIEEKFEDTFPYVFFDKVEHPGVPGIGYLRHGRERARQRLEEAGFSTETFEEGGDDDE